VLVLEAGGQGSVDSWRAILPALSRLAPVVAYDRSGNGKSEYDGQRPTVEHVVEVLHALLEAVHVPPPYVLAGVSWGGVLIRGFASEHPSEVRGLVFLDTTDYERTNEELATVIPPSSRPASRPALPSSIPPGIRAELEQISDYAAEEFSTIRKMAMPSVPIAVLIGGQPAGPLPPTALTKDVNIFRLMQIRHQSAWALSSPSGLVLVSTAAGHDVVKDTPELVIQAFKHVVDHATASTK
jgi:pimeloyl-ACP methyl ester carboxylesterase